mgnify:FL=1
MERLTKRSSNTTKENGVCCTHFRSLECCAVDGNCSAGCNWEEAAWERLAAYEDTGLTPENVEAIKLSMMGRSIAEIKEFSGVSIFRLQELAGADKAGRVVILGHPRRRVRWGDVDPDKLLCPECGNDLDGGFPEQTDVDLEMVNCPYCGEYLNLGRTGNR